MEKSELLQLVYACIERKEFYVKESITSFEKIKRHKSFWDDGFYYDMPKFELILPAKDGKKIYASDSLEEIFRKYSANFSDTKGKIKIPRGISIDFIDSPSIEINYILNKSEGQQHSAKLKLDFWQSLYRLRKTYILNCIEQENKPTYQISHGSITEIISLEEFEKIYKIVESNEQKFSNESETLKIKERLNKYSNKQEK